MVLLEYPFTSCIEKCGQQPLYVLTMLKVQALNRLRYIFGDCNLAVKGDNTMCNIKNKQ